VHFRIADIFLPGREELEIPARGEGEEELEGTVVSFSDSGAEHRAFAVVKVARSQNVVIPTTKLRVVSSSEHGEE
jgi:hypothetical protein